MDAPKRSWCARRRRLMTRLGLGQVRAWVRLVRAPCASAQSLRFLRFLPRVYNEYFVVPGARLGEAGARAVRERPGRQGGAELQPARVGRVRAGGVHHKAPALAATAPGSMLMLSDDNLSEVWDVTDFLNLVFW